MIIVKENLSKNILIVDDSALMRRFVSDIISSDDRFEVKDIARNGLEALELISKTNYDAVVMDINMPELDGIETLKIIQQKKYNVKVIVVSTVAEEGTKETIAALENGALDFIKKPSSYAEVKGEEFKREILRAVAVACGATDNGGRKKEIIKKPIANRTPDRVTNKTKNSEKLVALACSTGGPKSLKDVIPYLPADLDAPVVMVQHMPAGFTKSLAERLNELSRINVKEAEEGDILRKGWVYLAPGGRHIRVRNDRGVHSIALSDEPAIEGLRPCANVMYESLCDSSYDEIICVVLTGMGADGTKGIEKLKQEKDIYVIAQDQATCVVYGMPRAVAAAGLVDQVEPLNQVADAITKNTGVLKNGR